MRLSRNRITLVVLSAGVCVVVAACSSSSTASRSTATPVPWVNRAAVLWTPTATPTRTQPFPACTAGQLQAEYLGGSGYAGGYAEDYRLTNTSSSDCSLPGFPLVDGVRADGSHVQLYAPPVGANTQKVNLRSGDAADVQFTFPDCGVHLADRTPISTSGTFVSAVIVTPGGGDVTLPGAVHAIPPDEGGYSCGGGPQSYVPESTTPPLHTPFSGLTAKLSVPSVVTAGASFAFTVTLTNTATMNYALTPCPAYVEAVMVDGQTLSPQSHQLNCDVIKAIPPHSSVTYDMRYDVPNGVAASSVFLWSLVGWSPPAAEFVTAKATVVIGTP